jgi:hypothetical protein
MKTMQSNHFSPYFFTCSESRVEGKRYTEKVYRRVWKEACDKTGENIDVYRGTKTTRASQLMNEVGLSAAGGIEHSAYIVIALIRRHHAAVTR